MGRGVVDRLKAGQVAAKRADLVFVDVRDIFVPLDPHPLAHPRFSLPPKPDLWLDIAVRGVEKPIVVRDDGLNDHDVRVLLLVDGARRLSNTLHALTMLLEYPEARTVGALAAAAGVSVPADMDPTWDVIAPKNNQLFVAVEFFTGDDIALLNERLRRNADRLKEGDSVPVLALTVGQLARAGCSDHRLIASYMPKGVGPSEVEALSRYDNLTSEAKERFATGAPIGILRAVLDAPRERQVEKIDELVKAGITSTASATRHENKRRADRAAERGEVFPQRLSTKKMGVVANRIRVEDDALKDAAEQLGGIGGEDSAKAIYTILQAGIERGLRIARGERVSLPQPVAVLVKDAREGGRV